MSRFNPPTSPFDPLPRQPDGSPVSSDPFTVGSALSAGWRTAFSANYGLFLGVLIVSALIYFAASLPGVVIPLWGLIVGVFLAPLQVGTGFLFVQAFRRRPVHFVSMFDAFGFYWSLVLANLLQLLVSVVIYLPVVLVFVVGYFGAFLARGSGSPSPMFLCTAIPVGLACGVGALYVAARLDFTGYFIMDAGKPSMAVTHQMSRTWELTGQYAWPLVGLKLLLSILGALCAVPIAIPFLLTRTPLALLCAIPVMLGLQLLIAPFSFATMAAAYAMIRRDVLGDEARICLYCGYTLTGTTAPNCPECGAPVEPRPAAY